VLGKLASFNPYPPSSTSALMLTLWDDIESMRHGAYIALAGFPAPLPGFADSDTVTALMRWALWTLNSPRVCMF